MGDFGVSSNESGSRDGAVADSDGRLDGGDWANAGYGGYRLNGRNILEGEVRFEILIAGCEFIDDTIDSIFGGVGANDDEVGADLVDLGSDETVDATG